MAKTKNTVKAVNQGKVTQNIAVEREPTTIKLELSPSLLKDPANRQMIEEFVSVIKKIIPDVKVENDNVFLFDVDDLDKYTKATETKSKKAPKPPVKTLKNKKK